MRKLRIYRYTIKRRFLKQNDNDKKTVYDITESQLAVDVERKNSNNSSDEDH